MLTNNTLSALAHRYLLSIIFSIVLSTCSPSIMSEELTDAIKSDFAVSADDKDYFGWLPGESLNVRTGELDYYVTDFRIKGNGPLDIVLNRKFSKKPNDPLAGNQSYPDMFGSMSLDIPRIEFTNKSSVIIGTDVEERNSSIDNINSQNTLDVPLEHITENTGTDLCKDLELYNPNNSEQGHSRLYSGIIFHINNQKLHFFPKNIAPSTTRFPTDAEYVNQQNWYISCNGKQWKVHRPNGMVYTLDQYERRNTKTLVSSRSVDETTGNSQFKTSLVMALRNRVYVSKITDKWNNSLNYHYDTLEKRVPKSGIKEYAYIKLLKNITASDGRVVTINRQGDDDKECPSLIKNIHYNYDNSQNLSYEYANNVECNALLERVVRRDGSTFHYQYFNPINDTNNPPVGNRASWPTAISIPNHEGDRWTGHALYALKSITYPEGAKVNYNYTHLNKCRHTEEIELEGSAQTCQGYAALHKRTISGDLLPAGMTWRFGYQLTGVEGSSSNPLVARTVVDGPIVNKIRNRQLFAYPIFEANTHPRDASAFSGQLLWHQVIEVKNSLLTQILYDLWGFDPLVSSSDQKTVVKETQYQYSFGPGVVDFSQLASWSESVKLPWQSLHYSRDRRVSEKIVKLDNIQFRTAYSLYDQYNNPKRIGQYHDDSGPDQIGRTLDVSYYNNSNPWIVGEIKTLKVDQEDAEIFNRSYTAEGAIKDEYQYGIKSTSAYHTHGELHQVTDGRNINIRTFKNYKLGVPQRIEKPAANGQGGHVYKTVGVNSRGQVISESDWTGGNATVYGYNLLGYQNKETIPGQTTTHTKWPVWHVPGHENYRKKSSLRGSFYKEVTEYDALGRPIREYALDTGSNKHKIIYYKYAANGELAYRSLPTNQVLNLTQVVDGSITPPTGIAYQYDALNRVVWEKNTADNSITQQCYGNSTRCASLGLSGWVKHGVGTVDAEGYWHAVNYRAFGDPNNSEIIEILQQKELNKTNSRIQTSITRDRLGFITRVTQDGKSRHYTYKPGKRLLATVTHPETGTTTFSNYDLAGNLILKRNAAGDTTFYNYYNSGLLKYVDTTDADVTYTYTPNEDIDTIDTDGISNNNPLASVLDYDYRADGLLETETLTFDGKTMVLRYGYNGFGDLNKIVYPTGQPVRMMPNVFGQVEKITNYIDQISYHPNGQIAGATYANGQIFSATQTNRQFPKTWTSKSGDTYTIDQTYAYDKRGNVKSLTDHATPAYSLSNMEYDGLNRLKKANGYWGVGRFSYNNGGDITSLRLGSETLTYDYNHTYTGGRSGLLHQVTSTSGLKNYQFDYDRNGNVIDNGRFSFFYDNASRMTHADVNGRTYDFVYDGNGRRIRSTRQDTDSNNNPIAGTQITEYFFYNQAGKLMHQMNQNSNLRKDHIYLNGKYLAFRSYYNYNRDSDGDGMPDYYEDFYGLALDYADATQDSDNDGLSNIREFEMGANPHNSDTDNDGIDDILESVYNLNIVQDDGEQDADGDGITNINEVIQNTSINDALTQGRMQSVIPSINILFGQ